MINIPEDQAMRKGYIQGGNINNKQQRRNGGTLWGADGNWRESPRGTREEETAGPAREEGLDPGHEVVSDVFGAEGQGEDVGIHIVKPTFDI